MRAHHLLRNGWRMALSAMLLLTQSRSMAQTYSENVVGYMDVTLASGFHLIANPLDAGDNSISNLFRQVPGGSLFVPWDPVSQSFSPTITFVEGTGWVPGTAQLVRGEGAFLSVPSPVRVSAVGEPWPSGCLNFPAGSRASAVLPLLSCGYCGGLTEPCPLDPPDGTQVLGWNAATQSYDEPSTYVAGLGWLPFEPSLAPFAAAIVVTTIPLTARADGPGARSFIRAHLINPFLSGATFRCQFQAQGQVSYCVKRSSSANPNEWVTILRESARADGGLVSVTDTTATNAVSLYKLECLRLLNPSRVDTSFSFQFYAEEGVHYRVTRAVSWRTGPWEEVQVVSAATSGGLMSVTDRGANRPAGYYRVEQTSP